MFVTASHSVNMGTVFEPLLIRAQGRVSYSNIPIHSIGLLMRGGMFVAGYQSVRKYEDRFDMNVNTKVVLIFSDKCGN